MLNTINESSIEEITKQMDEAFGKGAIFTGKDKERLEIKWMPTGILALDKAIKPNKGSGGIPRGRIIEIYGPESSGKTSIALMTIAQEQKYQAKQENPKICAFFDNENTFNPFWAEMLGVDTDSMAYSKESTGEMTYDMIEALIKTGKFSIIAIDSLAGLAPLPELQSDMSQQHMGLAARMNSKAMRKLCATLSNNECTLIIMNQLREKIGIMFGNPEITPGGKALGFYASLRIACRKSEIYSTGTGDEREEWGHKMRIRIAKNKVGTAGQTCTVDLIYGKGFDLNKDLLDMAESYGIIKKSGGWRTYIPLGIDEDDKEHIIKDNGIDKFISKLYNIENHELILQEIKERILEKRTEPLYYADLLQGEKTNEETKTTEKMSPEGRES
jgi:recombination protein RecA